VITVKSISLKSSPVPLASDPDRKTDITSLSVVIVVRKA
jgi:hypothetical protein